MSDIVTFNYTPGTSDKPLSELINQYGKGGIKAGFYNGFLVENDDPDYIKITSGLMYTREGVRIEATADKPSVLQIPALADGAKRFDRVVLRHNFIPTFPNTVPTYEIVEGTPDVSAPQIPDEPADGMTLAVCFKDGDATEYLYIANTNRFDQKFRTIIIGDGDGEFGDLNGLGALEQVRDFVLDSPAEILVVSSLYLPETFELPSNWILRGHKGYAQIVSPASPVIKCAGFQSLTGTTLAGTKILEDLNVDFTQYSELSGIIINSPEADAGEFKIAKRVDGNIHQVELDADENFEGNSVIYKLMCLQPRIEGVTVYQQTNGGDGIDFTYSELPILRDVIAGAASPGAAGSAFKCDGFTDTPTLEGLKAVGGWTKALDVAHVTNGGAKDCDFSGGDIDVASSCAGFKLDNVRPGGVLNLNSDTCGALGFPINVMHKNDGDLKDDIVGPQHIEEEAIQNYHIDQRVHITQRADNTVSLVPLTYKNLQFPVLHSNNLGSNDDPAPPVWNTYKWLEVTIPPEDYVVTCRRKIFGIFRVSVTLTVPAGITWADSGTPDHMGHVEIRLHIRGSDMIQKEEFLLAQDFSQVNSPSWYPKVLHGSAIIRLEDGDNFYIRALNRTQDTITLDEHTYICIEEV